MRQVLPADPSAADLRSLMAAAIADRVFPGAVLAVAHEGRVRFLEAFGLADRDSGSRVKVDTIFDLASLTKPLATTLAVMRLVEHARLDLDAALSATLAPPLPPEADRIRIRHLLAHTSGLAAYRPYYLKLSEMPMHRRKEALKLLISAEPLEHPVGRKTLYSDLGFMLLALVVESVAQMPLDRFVAEQVYDRLGLSSRS